MAVSLTTQIHIPTDPFDYPVKETVRFSMHKKLVCIFSERPLPAGYNVVPYSEALLPAFSAVTRMAYLKSPDRENYPELGTRLGCNELINELAEMPGFQTEASWLLRWNNEPVAVVMSRRLTGCVFGEIQLIAVVPRHRRKGLASYLVARTMCTLKDMQLSYVTLNVNRGNRDSVRFFRRLGFQVNSEGIYS